MGGINNPAFLLANNQFIIAFYRWKQLIIHFAHAILADNFPAELLDLVRIAAKYTSGLIFF